MSEMEDSGNMKTVEHLKNLRNQKDAQEQAPLVPQEGIREALVSRLECLDSYYSENHEHKTLVWWNDVIKVVDETCAALSNSAAAPHEEDCQSRFCDCKLAGLVPTRRPKPLQAGPWWCCTAPFGEHEPSCGNYRATPTKLCD